MEIILEVKNVSKRFGGLWALKNVSVLVNKGDMLGIIGPNGAGKTTLFNVISGIYKPNGGRIIYKGKDITGLPPYKINMLGIARTFQVTRPFKELTVFENVLAGCLSKSRSYEDAAEKAYKIIEFTKLSGKEDILGKDLNILDQKRLELARAIATEPELLLLDEVMAGLKTIEIEEIFDVIRDLNSKGITIIIVEHVIKAIRQLCNKVIVLHYGEKIAEGTPIEVSKNELVIKAYLGEEYAASS